jgi:succinoglycan biosynthesis transport protein ExoP
MTTNLDKHFVTLTSPDTFAAERYQGLRLKLEQMQKRDGKKVIAITSPGAGDGKTVTSVNLAGVLASQSDSRILLIDADLRRKTVGTKLGIESGAKGFADLIASDKLDLAKLVQRPEPCRFDILPAGGVSMSVQDLIRSPRLVDVLNNAREHYDFVLLDTPPLLPVFDAAVLARAVDGVVMVVAADRTPRKMLANALDLLEPSSVVGIVFNADDTPMFGYYNSAYAPYFEKAAR